MFTDRFSAMIESAFIDRRNRDLLNVTGIVRATNCVIGNDIETQVAGINLVVGDSYTNNVVSILTITRDEYDRLIRNPANRSGVGMKLYMYQMIKDRGLIPAFYEAAKKTNMDRYLR